MKSPFWVDLLLRLYPEEFRDAHRPEVDDFVREELANAGARRPWVGMRLAVDLARAGVRLRLRPVQRGIWALMRRDGGEGSVMGMLSDARLAVRGLLRSGGFTAVVVTTLALGVGLNTALFSVVNRVLLKPLDYPEADRLVFLDARLAARDVGVTVSGGDLTDLRDGVDEFSALEGIASIRQNLNGAGLPRQVSVGWTSPGFMEMLGTEPALGRVHTADDAPGTVVISHRLWSSAFGSEADVLGRTIQLDGYPATIVGVMPASFRVHLPPGVGMDADVWKNPDAFWQNGDIWSSQGPEFGLLQLVGRLAPDADLASAQAQVDVVVADLHERFPQFVRDGFEIEVVGLQDRIVGEVRPTLLLLLGAVALVLLIACANVANLLAVRGRARVREMAIRLALGSPRRRIGRLMVLESLLLAAAGTGLGLLLASFAVELIPSLAPPELPLPGAITLDGTVLAFSAGLALFTTLLVGVAPAVGAVRTDPGSELGNGRVLGVGGARMRDVLVVGQVALSLVLLIGAGLLTVSLARLQDVDLGFEPEDVFTFGVSIPGAQYGWPEEAGQFYREVEARVAALPGVNSAGVVWPMPFGGEWSGPHAAVDGEPVPLGSADYRLVTEAYFPTVEIPLLDGRHFRDGDAREVIIVSESVAQAAWPGLNPVGRTLRANPWGGAPVDYEVIGVVGDIVSHDLREAPTGTLYFDARTWSWVDWEVHVVARTEVAAAALIPSLREAVAALDPEVPLARPEWMADAFAEQTSSTRFVLLLLGAFALTAAVLAVIGLYGVISYSVGLRAREFGVRIALGSGNTGIVGMVVRRGMALTAVGVALGVAGAWLLGGVLEALLYSVTPTDPLTFVGVAALLATAALAASWLPAWRASRVDPVKVLRAD